MKKLHELFSDKERLEKAKNRFWNKTLVKGKDDCWDWQCMKNDYGYGMLTCGRGYYFRAHRFSKSLQIGKAILDTDVILHKCDNPACVNPDHLSIGTKKDNTRDMINKKRNSNPPNFYGENHHNSKFKKDDLEKIISDKRPYKLIALDYGVCYETIGRVKRKQTWIKDLK